MPEPSRRWLTTHVAPPRFLLFVGVLVGVGALAARWLADPRMALLVATLLLAWLFANTVFALHYAHLYYLPASGADRRGLEIPHAQMPDYWDFLYFSFTLGMTFQTSDIVVTGAHMRKVVLGHSMAAFFFNMGILAFAVNTLGGL
jgi:uncharacterized membrane protein